MTLQKNSCSHTAIEFSNEDYTDAVGLGDTIDPISMSIFTEIKNPVMLERKGEIYDLKDIVQVIMHSGVSPTTRREVKIDNLDPVQYYILDENRNRTPFDGYDKTVEKLKGLGWTHTVPISQNPVNPESRPHRNTQQTSPNMATGSSQPNSSGAIYLRGVPSFTSHPNNQISTVPPVLHNEYSIPATVPSYNGISLIAQSTENLRRDPPRPLSMPQLLFQPNPLQVHPITTYNQSQILPNGYRPFHPNLLHPHPITAYNQSQLPLNGYSPFTAIPQAPMIASSPPLIRNIYNPRIQTFNPPPSGLFVSHSQLPSLSTVNTSFYNFPNPATPGVVPAIHHQGISPSHYLLHNLRR